MDELCSKEEMEEQVGGGYGVVLVWRAGQSNSCTGVSAFGQVVILNWGLESTLFRVLFWVSQRLQHNSTVLVLVSGEATVGDSFLGWVYTGLNSVHSKDGCLCSMVECYNRNKQLSSPVSPSLFLPAQFKEVEVIHKQFLPDTYQQSSGCELISWKTELPSS